MTAFMYQTYIDKIEKIQATVAVRMEPMQEHGKSVE